MRLLLIISFLFFASCGRKDMTNVNYSNRYSKICIDGHVYYKNGNQLSIKLNKWGRPIKCKYKD